VTSRDDQRSPWLRDDWDSQYEIGASPPPSSSSEAADAGESGDSAPAGSTDPSRTQVVLAALVGVTLLGAGVVALARSDADGSAVPAATVGAAATDGTTPAEPVATTVVVDTTATPTTGAETDPAWGLRPIVPAEEVVWTESTIEVPPNLQDVAPTEVVALTATGVLHRIDLPSGRARAVDVSAINTGGSNLVLGEDAIVVYEANTIYRIADGGPVTATNLPAGAVFVQSRPGTGQFVVTSPTVSDGDPVREWLLQPDGSIDRVPDGQFVDGLFWARTFSPTGDLLVNRPGGAYAVDGDGRARRIADGDLVATGSRHYAVEECDESLQCRVRVVDWSTGEAVVAAAGLRSDGLLDPSTRISPDGESVVVRGTVRAQDGRRIIDLRSGAAVDAGRVTKVLHPDTWTSDGRGLFRDAFGGVRFVDARTGEQTAVGDFTDVVTVATRPLLVPAG
jgi:hypothetical protein